MDGYDVDMLHRDRDRAWAEIKALRAENAKLKAAQSCVTLPGIATEDIAKGAIVTIEIDVATGGATVRASPSESEEQ